MRAPYSYTGVWPLIDRFNARQRKATEAARKANEKAESDRVLAMEAAEEVERAKLRRRAAAFEMGVVVTRRPAASTGPSKSSRQRAGATRGRG